MTRRPTPRALVPTFVAISGVLIAACFPQPTHPTSTTTTTTLAAASADLSVSQAVDDVAPRFFHVVTLTTTVHNDGPDDAAGVTATVVLPTGLTFVSASPGYDDATGTWTIGALADGADATLTISARAGDVALGDRTVTAHVDATTADPATGNDDGSVTLHSVPASLAVTITPDSANPALADVSQGGTMSWSSTVTSADDPGAPVGAPTFFFWSSATQGENPCPIVPDTGPTYSLQVDQLVIDVYTVSVLAVTGDPNYLTDGALSQVSFTTINSGG